MLKDFLEFRAERKRLSALDPRFTVRYDRADGHYREITLRAPSAEAAEEIAIRRLCEQFGPLPVWADTVDKDGDPVRVIVEGSFEYPHGPEVGQDNYQHKSTARVDR